MEHTVGKEEILLDDTGGVDEDTVVYEGDLKLCALERGQCCAVWVLDTVGEVRAVVYGTVAGDDVVFEEAG